MSSAIRSSLAELEATRALTLELVALCDDRELYTSLDRDFSPVGWHLGHVAAFEALWLLEHPSGRSVLSDETRQLFDPRENPKQRRGELPPRRALLSLARETRQRVLELPVDSIDPVLCALVLAHEQQHAETIATVLRMRPAARREASGWPLPVDGQAPVQEVLEVPAGTFLMGEPDPFEGYDNEHTAHEVTLGAFRLDATPVTNAHWRAFMEAGGYERKQWWTPEGWAWRERSGVTHPSCWNRADGWWLEAFGGDVALPLAHPVEGISAHEADAFARFSNATLPTEAEWERAARLFERREPHIGLRCAGTAACRPRDFIGNAWEWTSSVFAPYPGFAPHPYEGYSVPWFDGRHRVMRGGSWATGPRIARPGFRNWYEPHWRRMFAGLRLVRERFE